VPPIFLSRDGEQFGPYPPDDIQRMLYAGEVLPSDYYWHEGMEEWGVVGAVWSKSEPALVPTPVRLPASIAGLSSKARRRPAKGHVAVYALFGAVLFAAVFLFWPNGSSRPLPTPAARSTSPPPPATEPFPPTSEEHLKVVAWNLEWYPGGRMDASPEEAARHEVLAKEQLLKLKPDIFLAQEIRSWSDFERLVSSLPGLHTAVVSAFRFGGQVAQQQVAIASRLGVNCSWVEDWKRAAPSPPRGFSAAVLEVPSSNRLILVYSLHLKSNLTKRPGDEQDNYLKREESVRQLLAHVRDMEILFQGRISGVIVGGDFNTNHDGQFGDKSISMMVDAGFHNTWSSTPAEGRHTWRGSRQHRPTTLDYIFTKGISPLRALIFPTAASDHKPVAVWVPIADLRD
jgi:endonuclease/exonuclease/phosphatase family metal-dependent hydrolase